MIWKNYFDQTLKTKFVKSWYQHGAYIGIYP